MNSIFKSLKPTLSSIRPLTTDKSVRKRLGIRSKLKMLKLENRLARFLTIHLEKLAIYHPW